MRCTHVVVVDMEMLLPHVLRQQTQDEEDIFKGPAIRSGTQDV